MSRLRRGVYVDSQMWRDATPDQKYLLRVAAVTQTRETPAVVAYESAAALWGFSRVTPWPTDVHLVPTSYSGVRSRNGVRFHRESLNDDEICILDGVTVTTRERTLVDIARTASMLDAVVMLDQCLNGKRSRPHRALARDALLDRLASSESYRGTARAAHAIRFAHHEAANAGESYSRVLMHQFGMAAPHLQTEHPNPRGGRYFTDFEWPELHVIGEFDGRSKYLKPEYLGGMTPGEAVVAEKIREDDLRSEGNRLVRWIWSDLQSPARFAALLAAAGIPHTLRRSVAR